MGFKFGPCSPCCGCICGDLGEQVCLEVYWQTCPEGPDRSLSGQVTMTRTSTRVWEGGPLVYCRSDCFILDNEGGEPITVSTVRLECVPQSVNPYYVLSFDGSPVQLYALGSALNPNSESGFDCEPTARVTWSSGGVGSDNLFVVTPLACVAADVNCAVINGCPEQTLTYLNMGAVGPDADTTSSMYWLGDCRWGTGHADCPDGHFLLEHNGSEWTYTVTRNLAPAYTAVWSSPSLDPVAGNVFGHVSGGPSGTAVVGGGCDRIMGCDNFPETLNVSVESTCSTLDGLSFAMPFNKGPGEAAYGHVGVMSDDRLLLGVGTTLQAGGVGNGGFEICYRGLGWGSGTFTPCGLPNLSVFEFMRWGFPSGAYACEPVAFSLTSNFNGSASSPIPAILLADCGEAHPAVTLHFSE